MVHGGEGGCRLPASGCVPALAVSEVSRAPRLVQGGPGVDAIAERGAHDGRVLLERVGGRAGRPPSGVFESLRQVPVVQRRHGTDSALEQTVDEPGVEVDARLIRRTRAGRLDARPGDREAVRTEPEILHEIEVALPAVIVIARDVAGVAVPDVSGRLAEGVPDRGPSTALVEAALHLVRRRGRTEDEAFREDQSGVAVVGVADSHRVTSSRSMSKDARCPSGVVTATVRVPSPPGNTRRRSPSR